MANPQVENGHLKIADDIVIALMRSALSAAQRRILDAVMLMTYRTGKLKAQISVDDLRYATNLKSYTIEDALADLIERNIVFRQVLNDESFLLGIQKDWESWFLSRAQQIKLQKVGNGSKELGISTRISTRKQLPTIGKRATPPESFLEYLQKEMVFHYTIGTWRAEHSAAVELYKLALRKVFEPSEAFRLLIDYFEELADPGFRAKTHRPATMMLKTFPRYLKYRPDKSDRVKRDESYEGIHYRWSVKSQSWIPTSRNIT